MKIITKIKDYYDFLIGVYGEDPKIILDRRETEGETVDGHFMLFIGGKKIEGFVKDKIIYYGDDLKLIESSPETSKYWYNATKNGYTRVLSNNYHEEICNYITDDLDNYNDRYNCPILLGLVNNRSRKPTNFSKFPTLKVLCLPSFVSPELVYQWISQWLAIQLDKELEIKNDLSDIQKLENKGFDKKTSFRPNIKKL